ncbi:unnamed protein product [Arabis nemorensis]|uniref:Uncharacterized protein n=1 Tax=Arabis nemorensis TaxID=586526 RepID=A0A565C3N1_9BRAS|nr:unnamed protein product [Arabis nemorensis]
MGLCTHPSEACTTIFGKELDPAFGRGWLRGESFGNLVNFVPQKLIGSFLIRQLCRKLKARGKDMIL